MKARLILGGIVGLVVAGGALTSTASAATPTEVVQANKHSVCVEFPQYPGQPGAPGYCVSFTLPVS